MAELLADDAEHVEKVLLLVARLDCAETSEMPSKFDGRLLVWNRMTFGTNAAQNVQECQEMVNKIMLHMQTQPNLWEKNGTQFLPSADKPYMGNLDYLKNRQKLIGQLDEHNFNVGIMETNPGEFALSLLATFPTMKKFVGSQSTSPTIAHWKYFGYDKIVGAMPGRDLAKIGDHKFATESAIKENPNYFRERNEDLYIKPVERTGRILQHLYLDAIENGLLPRQFPDDFALHENFTEWEMQNRMDLYFTNVQPFLDFPVVEQEIERERQIKKENRVNFIGGITMPKGVVPKMNGDTKQIFESANSENENGGVVLLSFGSVVEMNDGEAHAVAVKNIVVEVFKQYPQMNMIIKWGKRAPIGTGEQYKKLADNVYAKSWLEQSAILDGGLKLFITHGGQNSINEAVKSGVPLILFPFFGDQFNNAEALAARGVAKVIDIRSKRLKNDFAEALNEMLTNYAEYKQKMDELSTKMNALLLVSEADCAEPTEVPPKFEGRLLVWHRMTFSFGNAKNCAEAVAQFKQQQNSWWQIWKGTNFLPHRDVPYMAQFDFLIANRKLINELKSFQFNVGILETGLGDFSMSILRAFPTIKKFVGSQSISPTISQWKYFGYDKIVGAMPGRDLARINDHKLATKSAIKENPNHFRQRNEDFYIKPVESSTLLLRQKYVDAINRGLLSKDEFGDFIRHEQIASSWDIQNRMDLYFTNVQPFLDFPVVEQEIERERQIKKENRVNFIGGITMPKGVVPKLNGDTKQIFESANSENENGGVVLLSFGSVVEMNDGEAHAVAVKNIVVEVFKQYPQMNMIIKWGKRAPIGTGEQYKKLAHNVYAKSWLEQSAILDGGLKLFITHGGQNSINEAVKSGVPLILFPFFGDQFNNAEALAARGVAKVIDIRSKTLKNDFEDALNEMLTNYAEHKQKMDELSTKMNAVEPEKEFIEKFRQLRKRI
ncbi:hypothetical protein niasHT_006673 [Heterodera trifolii]|uniref:glucuronosyltransferase n=1 Tax=Heterodera trifolii TaxID=157864 RepID=A0ABD2MC79_9BILA